jgi:predicted dehydrogenase
MMLLVGAGPMAIDHSKVLDALNEEYVIIGRGEESALKFETKTGHPVFRGGVSKYIASTDQLPEKAIVSVGVEHLSEITRQLIRNGVKRVLVEKPAGLTLEDIEKLSEVTDEYKAEVFVAYNRRLLSSVMAAQEIIEKDGGVENFTFEVTEWGHSIEPLQKAYGVKENWFLGNTSHVVDLAFYLGGDPLHLSSFTTGGTSWHQRSAIFAGAGETKTGTLFSYHGNWNAPGRWSLDILTRKHRLIFCPLEKLQIQKLGTIVIEEVEINDALDVNFKPGLYRQLESFLKKEVSSLCTIKKHLENCRFYTKMANYD